MVRPNDDWAILRVQMAVLDYLARVRKHMSPEEAHRLATKAFFYFLFVFRRIALRRNIEN